MQQSQNGYAERLMRTIREEEVDLSEYQDYHDAYEQFGHFNNKRSLSDCSRRTRR